MTWMQPSPVQVVDSLPPSKLGNGDAAWTRQERERQPKLVASQSKKARGQADRWQHRSTLLSFGSRTYTIELKTPQSHQCGVKEGEQSYWAAGVAVGLLRYVLETGMREETPGMDPAKAIKFDLQVTKGLSN